MARVHGTLAEAVQARIGRGQAEGYPEDEAAGGISRQTVRGEGGSNVTVYWPSSSAREMAEEAYERLARRRRPD